MILCSLFLCLTLRNILYSTPAPKGLFQNEGNNEDDDSGTDYGSGDKPFLKKAEHVGSGLLPGIFQTNQLLFYERFKAYQDYMLGNHQTFSSNK